jgi:methionine-rich copper-binding protein CopC
MSRRRTAIRVGLVLLGALTAAGTALAHARLVKAEPAPGSTVKAAPRVVRAVFNDELDPRRSTLTVVDAQGRRMDDGKGGVDLNDLDRKTMVAAVRALGPGAYTVRWKATSADDQYVTSGSFRFTVAR